MTEGDALLALNAVPDLGAVRIRRLVAYFESAQAVWRASVRDLETCRILQPGMAENIFHFSKDKFIQDEYNLMRRKGVSVITADSPKFPSSLKDFSDAPVVLYIKGDAICLQDDAVAMVGSRAASLYGCRSARTFAKAFVDAGLTVVSGLARGIDTASHQGALEAGGKTIAVIGCGFNFVYPKENTPLMESIAAKGAVITEFAFSMPPLKHNFPWRNRIISALSKATVVIEAGQNSGSLITADFAIAQHKDVFVLPSNIDNETALGSNQLIRDGALVALSPQDVLSQIKAGYSADVGEESQELQLSEEQEKVYPYITYEPIHVDDIARQTGINISSLMIV